MAPEKATPADANQRPIGYNVRMRNHRLGLGLFACLTLFLSTAHACQIPVFRYALERWAADPYEVIVFHRGALSPPQQKAVDLLAEGQDLVNLKASTVDLAGTVDPALLKVWESQKGATLPWVVVRYPHANEEVPLAWAGALTQENLRSLLDSPARRQIAKEILAGQSAVWVLVETGQRNQDEAAAKALTESLRKAEKELTLPKIDDNDDGPKLLLEMPVKLAFTILRISPSDPAEKAFVQTLVRSGDYGTGKPMAFPIFGRGRALGPLVGDRIEAEEITDGAIFLCGACSCQVKSLNPGFDVLMGGDWEAPLEGRKPRELAIAAASMMNTPTPVGQVVPVPVRQLDLLKVGSAVAVGIFVLLGGAWMLKGRRV